MATKTISSVGGSIIVRQDGDNLIIVSTNAAPGFQAGKPDHSDHGIGLTFTSATHRSEITARLSDGTIKFDVKENDAGGQSATTDSSGGGDHGGGSDG